MQSNGSHYREMLDVCRHRTHRYHACGTEATRICILRRLSWHVHRASCVWRANTETAEHRILRLRLAAFAVGCVWGVQTQDPAFARFCVCGRLRLRLAAFGWTCVWLRLRLAAFAFGCVRSGLRLAAFAFGCVCVWLRLRLLRLAGSCVWVRLRLAAFAFTCVDAT